MRHLLAATRVLPATRYAYFAYADASDDSDIIMPLSLLMISRFYADATLRSLCHSSLRRQLQRRPLYAKKHAAKSLRGDDADALR